MAIPSMRVPGIVRDLVQGVNEALSRPKLVKGARVQVHSLQSADHVERNGCYGTLQRYDPEKERWQVKFEEEGAVFPAPLSLRPANLEYVSAPAHTFLPPCAQSAYFAWPAQVHPSDVIVGVSPSIFKDPNSFAPSANAASGVVLQWGMDAKTDEILFLTRQMNLSACYGRGGIEKTPEQQWVAVRKEAKRNQLSTSSSESALCDLEIRIELVHGFERGVPKTLMPPIWREMRLSGDINLGVFQDKVLSPVIGWTRNYHGYYFTDLSDGCLWCPIGTSTAIDMMHVALHVVDALDPFETKLHELLTEPGARIGYTYDLGDRFEHVITCTKVLSAAESTGAATVLAGAMRCPNEDGNGNSVYQEEVLDMLGQSADCPLGPACAAACKERSKSMNCATGEFDPYEFSVASCQDALGEALSSKASAQSGTKKFIHVLSPHERHSDFGGLARPGEKHISDHFSGVSETEGGRAQQRIFLTGIYLCFDCVICIGVAIEDANNNSLMYIYMRI